MTLRIVEYFVQLKQENDKLKEEKKDLLELNEKLIQENHQLRKKNDGLIYKLDGIAAKVLGSIINDELIDSSVNVTCISDGDLKNLEDMQVLLNSQNTANILDLLLLKSNKEMLA